MNGDSKSQTAEFAQRYGAYMVGFLAPLGALVAAYFMPGQAKELFGAAVSLAVCTLFFSNENQPFGTRLLGMVVAGVALVAACLIPAQAADLLSGAGVIAAAAIIFTGEAF